MSEIEKAIIRQNLVITGLLETILIHSGWKEKNVLKLVKMLEEEATRQMEEVEGDDK